LALFTSPSRLSKEKYAQPPVSLNRWTSLTAASMNARSPCVRPPLLIDTFSSDRPPLEDEHRLVPASGHL
jgi:hypothetical protein